MYSYGKANKRYPYIIVERFDRTIRDIVILDI